MAESYRPKRKNSEKRKAKSRDAARVRRSQEAEIFRDLSLHLPISPSLLAQFDKASILRLAISHLKLATFVKKLPVDIKKGLKNGGLANYFLDALDGYLLILTNCGQILYVSDSVFTHLGISQVDMLGQSVFDFVHPCDLDVLQGQVQKSSTVVEEKLFAVRMKCAANNKLQPSNHVGVKSTNYKMVAYGGRTIAVDRKCVKRRQSGVKDQSTAKNSEGGSSCYLVLTGKVILDPTMTSMLLDGATFVSCHTLDMKFTYCDQRVIELLGYEPSDLIGRSIYSFHHPFDSTLIQDAYKLLFNKGDTVLGMYRFAGKSGRYFWLETSASIRHDPRQLDDDQVICVHCVIGRANDCGVQYSVVPPLVESTKRRVNQLQDNRVMIDESEEIKPLIDQSEEVIEVEEGVVEEVYEYDDENMQFMTEEILGLCGDLDNKVDCSGGKSKRKDEDTISLESYEMKAPFIPVDGELYIASYAGENGKMKNEETKPSGSKLASRTHDKEGTPVTPADLIDVCLATDDLDMIREVEEAIFEELTNDSGVSTDSNRKWNGESEINSRRVMSGKGKWINQSKLNGGGSGKNFNQSQLSERDRKSVV